MNQTFKQLIIDMRNCKQTKGQSVLQHGLSVKDYTFDIINHLKYGTTLKYEKNAKEYQIKIVSPSGDIFGPINNLSKFCKEKI